MICRRKPDAVVRAVAVEVGVEIRACRQPHAPGLLQGGPAQRPLGHHMDEIRQPAFPGTGQGAARRQSHAQALVARQRDARDQQLLELRPGPGDLTSALAWARELHAMPASEQPIQHPADGHRHAVDLGREGFGHQRDAQRGSGWRVFRFARPSGGLARVRRALTARPGQGAGPCAASLTAQRESFVTSA